MDWNIKSRNMKLHETQRDQIQDKLGRLNRFLEGITDVKVECRFENQRGLGEIYIVQATIMAEHGVILRAEERDKDLLAAVDQVNNNLQRQIRRFKEKHYRRGRLRRSGGELVISPLAPTTALETEDGDERQIIREKELTLRPMFSDEAIEQMELLGHSFFVYRDAETEKISVVYRRHDGNYGLLMPR